jgi:hypothetical protein
MLVGIEIRNEADSAIELPEFLTFGGQSLYADITDAAGRPVEMDAAIFEPYAPPVTLEPGQVCRPGADHLDVETTAVEENARPVDLTLRLLTAREPFTAEEVRRQLGI